MVLWRNNEEDWTIRRKFWLPSLSCTKMVARSSSETTRRVSLTKILAMELSPDWVVGFVDGEGCFHVSINKQPEMKIRYQVLAEFVVVQHQRDAQILQALKRFFKGGVVRVNHGDRLCFRVRKLETLAQVCLFFQRHPLKTKKQVDFVKFRKVIDVMSSGEHLTIDGLRKVIGLAKSMNLVGETRFEEVLADLGEG